MAPRKRAPTIPVVVWWTLAAAFPEADALAEDLEEVPEAAPPLVVEARVDDAFRLWLETVPLVELPPARAVLTPEEGTTAAGAVLAADTEVTVVALMIGTGMRVERAEEVATGATSALDSTAEEMEEATTLDTTALETDSTAEETEAAALGADEATTAEEAASVTGA
jgi:hypothetical protein